MFVYADIVSGGLVTGENPTPRIVFTNEEIPSQPNLYITKAVTSVDENGEIPENDEFTFTLRIDGKLAENKEYRLFDKKGTEFNDNIHISPKEEDDEIIKNLGPEVANKVENDSVAGDVIEPFKTDDLGSFTLKEGQVAVFEELGSGTAYEVKENSRDGYIQIEPSGGASVPGTMKDKAEIVTFTNLYVPNDDGEKTNLEVRKSVSFPTGYTPFESPDFPFELVLKGGYEADEEHKYVISDIKTGNVVSQGTMLGNRVQFTLKGGQKATFQDIDADIDYEVKELELSENENLDGWRQTYSSGSKGTTISPVTPVVFNNASAAFVVTKNMEDNSKPDQEFTFQLTKGKIENCSVWKDAKYYLYSTTGEMITPEETAEETPDNSDQTEETSDSSDQTEETPDNNDQTEETSDSSDQTEETPDNSDQTEETKKNVGVSGITDEQGLFKLKPGQAAVFVNVEPGTIYNVSEISNPDYIQTVPNSTEGYINKTVSQAVEVLPFVNKEAGKALTVTKKLTYSENDNRRPADQQKFYFILSEKVETEKDETEENKTEQYNPVVNAIYKKEVGGSEYTEKTDKKGGFWVGANETVRFFDLTKGKSYKVEEQNLDSYSIEYELSKGCSQEGKLTGSEGLEFTFENLYTPDKLDLYLVKANNLKEIKMLEGAKFRLFRVDVKESKNDSEESGEGTTGSDGENDSEESGGGTTGSDGENDSEESGGETIGSDEKIEKETEIGTYITDKEGKITVPGLSSGKYRLYEIEAPVGYQLMEEPVTLQVERIKNTNVDGSKKLRIFINGNIEVQAGDGFKDHSKSEEVNSSKEPEGYFVMGQGSANDELHIRVYNDPLYDLPSAGGSGIFLYILSGIVLMMAASYLYWKKYRLQEA